METAAKTYCNAEIAEVFRSLADSNMDLTEDLESKDRLKAGASALKKIEKVYNQQDTQFEVYQTVEQVRIMMRDIIVLLCLVCDDCTDRDHFKSLLMEAFDDNNLPIDLFLLAHRAVRDGKRISNTFRSRNATRTFDRRGRERSKIRPPSYDNTAAALSKRSPSPHLVPVPKFARHGMLTHRVCVASQPYSEQSWWNLAWSLGPCPVDELEAAAACSEDSAWPPFFYQ